MKNFFNKLCYHIRWVLSLTLLMILILVSYISFIKSEAIQTYNSKLIEWNDINNDTEIIKKEKEEKKYIKWFEFKVTYDVLDKTSKLDINSHIKDETVKYNWIELISYLACKYGNDFSRFKQKDLDGLIEKLKNGQTMEEITKDMKNYSYYFEGYDSVLHEFIGNYSIESNNQNTINNQQLINNSIAKEEAPNIQYEEKYGLKAFHPLAKNYSYSHYDDFGNSRSYGYKRLHFGNDLMGSIGAPVIAVESGVIEAVRLESIWWLENWY